MVNVDEDEYKVYRRAEFFPSGITSVCYDVISKGTGVNVIGKNSLEELAEEIVAREIMIINSCSSSQMHLSTKKGPVMLFEPLSQEELYNLGKALTMAKKGK